MRYEKEEFIREICDKCLNINNTFKLETIRYASIENKTVSLKTPCKECDGFGYILKRIIQKNPTVKINCEIHRYLKLYVKEFGFDTIKDRLCFSEEILKLILSKEKKICSREEYEKICYIINSGKLAFNHIIRNKHYKKQNKRTG